MLTEKRNACGNLVCTGTDTDGDDFTVEFYGAELIELMAESDTGCIVLDKERALELARCIIDRLNNE